MPAKIVLNFTSPGAYKVTGFTKDKYRPVVTALAWGGGGGNSDLGGAGAGGSFAQTYFSVNQDTQYIEVAVGSAGANGRAPGAGASYYSGGATNGAWASMLNSLSVWEGNGDYTWRFYFPATQSYNFDLSVDNYGTLYVDEVAIVYAPSYNSVWSGSKVITEGWHTIRINGINTGGPASIGARILQNGNQIWTTRSPRNVVISGNGGGYYTGLNFDGRGGFGQQIYDADNDQGSGAGGGGASAVMVVTTATEGVTHVCVAGGGGGGGGNTDDGSDGQDALGVSSADIQSGRGGDGSGGYDDGPGGGGGGGGGWRGGAGGGGTQGGKNGSSLGDYTEDPRPLNPNAASAGQPTNPYRINNAGNYTRNGQVTLIFSKITHVFTKVNGSWKPCIDVWRKENGVWKSIDAIYVKKGGVWKLTIPPGSPTGITGTRYSSN
jgi:hypothetical protein